MTHYSDNPNHVRCDIFRASGKWYQTVMLDLTDTYTELMPECLIKAYTNQYGRMCHGMWAVVLEPYNVNSHPQMWVIPDVPGKEEEPAPTRREASCAATEPRKNWCANCTATDGDPTFCSRVYEE